MILPGHRTQAAHLPEEPLQHLEAAAQVFRQELAGPLGEIKQDRAGLEDAHGRAAAGRILVEHRRHAVVGRDAEKIGLELLAFADVDAVKLVRKSGFLEKHRHFVAVGRGPIVELDHRARLLA
jgi:hypothetical protein